MSEIIKFNDETRVTLHNISSTDSRLTFSVLDNARNGLEEICKDAEKTSVIRLLSVNNAGEETTLKGYAGYTKLVSMKTEYGVTTNIDYETPDSTTGSGFAEEKHDVTTVILAKPTQMETVTSVIEDLQASQAEQDEIIAELMFGGEE